MHARVYSGLMFCGVVFDVFVCLHDFDLLLFVAFINVTELFDRIERSLSKHGMKDPCRIEGMVRCSKRLCFFS